MNAALARRQMNDSVPLAINFTASALIMWTFGSICRYDNHVISVDQTHFGNFLDLRQGETSLDEVIELIGRLLRIILARHDLERS